MNRQIILWVCIFFLLSTLFIARFKIVGQAVYGDGIYYWAYTRSIVIDKNLNFQNEGAHAYGPETNNRRATESSGTEKTDLANDKYYPLGPSILWIPVFALLHGIITIFNSLGSQLLDNGYADIYQITVGLTNVGFVVLGLFLLSRILRQFYSPFVAGTASLLTLFGTNLLYYGSLDVINSHPASFLLCSIFTCLFVLYKEKMSTRHWFGLGILLGVMSLVRLQDSLFLLMPLAFFMNKIKNTKTKTAFLTRVFGLLLGAFIGFLPQLLASKALYGTFFLIPYTLGGGQFPSGENKILQLFIDHQKGLLFYSPLFIAGLVGLLLLKGKVASLKLPFLVVIITVFILVGSWSGWSQGEAFGMRMFISLLPLIAFGIAEVTKRLLLRFSKTTIILIGMLFILQNLVMIAAFHLFFHNPTYIGSDLSESGKIKIELLQKIHTILK